MTIEESAIPLMARINLKSGTCSRFAFDRREESYKYDRFAVLEPQNAILNSIERRVREILSDERSLLIFWVIFRKFSDSHSDS